MREEYEFEPAPAPAWGMGSVWNTLNWEQVRSDVEREGQARVAIAGLRGAGKSLLLNRLRGWEVSAVSADAGDNSTAEEDLGLFGLVDLPGDGAVSMGLSCTQILLPGDNMLLAEADLILFVLDGAALAPAEHGQDQAGDAEAGAEPGVSLRPGEYQWLCRVRALGKPLLVVINKVDLLDGQLPAVQAEVERRLGMRVLLVSARDGTGIEHGLLTRMLDACPRLAVPLGRDIPGIRHRAANRLILQATLLSLLTGLEPVPLLDIPIQYAAQMRLLLRLSALHGRPDVGDGSRELVAAVAGGLGLRFAAQQLAKLVPVLGWAASGLLSGLSTWLLGQAAMAYLGGRLQARTSFLRRPTFSRPLRPGLPRLWPTRRAAERRG